MDYCSIIFGKKLVDLKVEDIETFFLVERVESDQLEFKSFNEREIDPYSNLKEAITAFLNSSGGVLIWGAPIGVSVQGRKHKKFLGPLTPIVWPLEKDTLISSCSDSIIPLPKGIRINLLSRRDWGIVCVFEIDESEYSPHQFRNIYSMRLDGQNKPAPHHYVEALFKKIRYPNLEGYLIVTDASLAVSRSQLSGYVIGFQLVFFNWSPLQNEELFSFYVTTELGVFPASDFQPHYRESGQMYSRDEYVKVFRYGEPIFHDRLFINVNSTHFNAKLPRVTKLGLTFGGKFSPSKSSTYTFDLSLLDKENPRRMIIEKIENELAKDAHDRIGLSKQNILKDFLEGPSHEAKN